MIWVEIEFPNYKVLLCVVYRSPGATQSVLQNFEYSIEEAFNTSEKVTLQSADIKTGSNKVPLPVF
jgi:hypothetical protein